MCTETNDDAYGPQSCQSLLTANAQNTLVNADSYGWFVTVCVHWKTMLDSFLVGNC